MSVQSEINRINNEVTSQADLIAQIQTALDGKAAVSASGEISITENGVHDVKQYATANVNVQSAPVLLWTNASPTSQFAAQTIAINGADYEAYIIEAKYNPTTASYGYTLNMIGGGQQSLVVRVSTSSMDGAGIYWRRVYNITASGISFAIGRDPGSENNNYCIPTRIWGVKFTL